jgi:hypothetical protein
MPHKVDPAPTGRASCRGCKQPIAKGTPRFAEEFQSPYSEEGGASFRYWHLACAATKHANDLAVALAAYVGPVEDRASLEALIAEHIRPEMPYAERAGSGRARCRACDVTVKKGELRVAFERVYDSPMGPQKAAAYAHPGCVVRYLERERERGRQTLDKDDAVSRVLRNSRLPASDLDAVERDMSAPPSR